VSGIKWVSVLNQLANTVVQTKKMIKTMSVEINKLHKILGHNRESLHPYIRKEFDSCFLVFLIGFIYYVLILLDTKFKFALKAIL
jgi:hypothetical protein